MKENKCLIKDSACRYKFLFPYGQVEGSQTGEAYLTTEGSGDIFQFQTQLSETGTSSVSDPHSYGSAFFGSPGSSTRAVDKHYFKQYFQPTTTSH
jgi:hypothetical protein